MTIFRLVKSKTLLFSAALTILALQGCSVIAANQVGLQQFLLVTASVATSEAVYINTKQIVNDKK